MVHTILISGHAVAGFAALVAGYLLIRHDRAAPAYLGSVMALVAFLLAAVASDWSSLGSSSRVTFGALTLLAGYVLWRAVRAIGTRRSRPGQQTPLFLHHLGFTLIALLVGFVAIAVLDLGAPIWLVVVAAIGCIAVGHVTLGRLKARESRLAASVSPNSDD